MWNKRSAESTSAGESTKIKNRGVDARGAHLDSLTKKPPKRQLHQLATSNVFRYLKSSKLSERQLCLTAAPCSGSFTLIAVAICMEVRWLMGTPSLLLSFRGRYVEVELRLECLQS